MEKQNSQSINVETTNEYGNKHFCRYCGSSINEDSIFCSQCGKKQDTSNSVFLRIPFFNIQGILMNCKRFIKKKVSHVSSFPVDKMKINNFFRSILLFILIAIISFIVGSIICLVIGDDAVDCNPLKGWGYVLPIIIFYIIYILVVKLFSPMKKGKIAFSVFFGVVTLFIIGFEVYKDLSQRDSILNAENAPIINRTFLTSSLGDSYSEVLEKTKIDFASQINDSLTDINYIVLGNVVYGTLTFDRVRFDFAEGKLYRVYFRKTYSTRDSKMAGYNSLIDIFESKNYPHDPYRYNKYSNSIYYSDKHTELEIRYSVPEHDGDKQFIQLFYYDKDSNIIGKGL